TYSTAAFAGLLRAMKPAAQPSKKSFVRILRPHSYLLFAHALGQRTCARDPTGISNCSGASEKAKGNRNYTKAQTSFLSDCARNDTRRKNHNKYNKLSINGAAER